MLTRTIALAFVGLLIHSTAQAQIVVNAGDNLQTALNNVTAGQTIMIQAGATFTGNFTLPTKVGTAEILVRTATPDASFPPDTARVAASDEALMPVIATANSSPALTTSGATANWRFQGIAFTAGTSTGDIITIGDSVSTTVAALPANIVFDRCIIRAASTAKNGLVMNASNVTIKNSRVTGIKVAGQETHAIAAWNGPGPFVIENNYIEAGSCGIFFGGAVPAVSGLIPSDILVRWNYVTRPLALESQTGWAIKNVFELKNAQRVNVYGNVFENNWPDSQSGWMIVLTVRANGPDAPWTTVQHVVFENNIVRHSAMAFNILGLDTQTLGCEASPGGVCPSTRMDDIIIRNNLVYDIDRATWTGPTGQVGTGVLIGLAGGPLNFQFVNNTMIGNGNIANVSGPDPIPGFVFRANIVQKATTPQATFGWFGTAVGEGNAAFAAFMPHVDGYADLVFTQNVLAGATASAYNTQAGNVFPAIATLFADFTNAAAGNYRLVNGSAFAGLGMDQDAIDAAGAGLRPGTAERRRRVRFTR